MPHETQLDKDVAMIQASIAEHEHGESQSAGKVFAIIRTRLESLRGEVVESSDNKPRKND